MMPTERLIPYTAAAAALKAEKGKESEENAGKRGKGKHDDKYNRCLYALLCHIWGTYEGDVARGRLGTVAVCNS